MRKIAPIVAGLALLAFVPTDASAWYCQARAPNGAWGWGRAVSRLAANRIALTNCAVRTPRGLVCYTTSCVP